MCTEDRDRVNLGETEETIEADWKLAKAKQVEKLKDVDEHDKVLAWLQTGTEIEGEVI